MKYRESITEYCIKFWHPHFYHGLKNIRESSEKSCKNEKRSEKPAV